MARSRRFLRTPTAATARRARRGSELIEFSLIFPLYLFVFFGIIEYSWYFFQRQATIEGARIGCQTVAQLDPEETQATKESTAASVIEATLRTQGGIDCGGVNTCNVVLTDLSAPPNNPPRVVCEVRVNFKSLTGFLGSDDDPGGPMGDIAKRSWGRDGDFRLIPASMVGRATSVYEEAD